MPWEKYTDALKSTFADYGDAALVTLSRSSGEGADLPSGLEALEPYMTGGDYLRGAVLFWAKARSSWAALV